MNRRVRGVAAAATLAAMGAVTGCSFDGLNSFALPGNSTEGEPVFTIEVEMADVQNLVGNSEVKAGNVTIGTVRSVRVDSSIAVLTVDLRQDAHLGSNSTATLAQKSLLGAQYLELATPAGQETVGQLRDGDVIPLSRTSRFPETEAVLSTLSLLLNGGGLQQIRTITRESNAALGGNEEEINALFGRVATFVDGLDSQRQDIVRAIDSLDRLSGELASQTGTIDRAVTSIQPALEVLDDQQQLLRDMLGSVGSAAAVANEALDASKDDLTANLANLAPTLTELAATGSTLANSLIIAGTIPFPVTTAANTIRGDYINLFMNLDISIPTLQNDVLGSIPDPASLLGIRTATGAVDPLLAPVGGGEPR